MGGTAYGEQEIERDIQAKGLNAPRLTPEAIDAAITAEQYLDAAHRRTVGVPVEELAHHLLGQRALLSVVPGTAEIEVAGRHRRLRAARRHRDDSRYRNYPAPLVHLGLQSGARLHQHGAGRQPEECRPAVGPGVGNE